MGNLPTPDESNIIARMPFVTEELGEIIAWHDREGPSIDLKLAPEGTKDRFECGFTPSEIHRLADKLHEVATIAQRAGWTPEVLAQAREKYLPGMTDAQIIERLDRLEARLGSMMLGHGARLDWQAGRMLTAELGMEALDQADAAVTAALDQFRGVETVAESLRAVQTSFAQLRRFYESESEFKL
jgi:hypothetical protein